MGFKKGFIDIFGIITVVIILIALIVVVIWGISHVNIDEFTQGECNLFPENVCDIFASVGFPRGWLSTDKVFFWIAIPMFGLFLIMYGFLSRIQIFGNWINGGLAVVIMLTTVPMGIFVVIVATMFSIMGMFSVIAFGILFGIGVFYFFKAKTGSWRSGSIERNMFGKEKQAIGSKMKECDKEIAMWNKQLQNLQKTRPPNFDIQAKEIYSKLDYYDDLKKSLKQEQSDLNQREKAFFASKKQEDKD